MQFFRATSIFTGIIILLQYTCCFSQLKQNQEKLKITVEFETSDFQLFTDNTYTPVTTYKGNTYFVWIDKNFRPKVGKIKNGKVSFTFLDPDPKYKVLDNKHHRFSIGVDQDGYLHVAGDMHHYPKSAVDHLPYKYRDGIIMYWVSDKPEDISSFSWMGKNISRALPGYGFTYLSFQHDMDGELYARCRNRIYKGPHRPGEMGYAIYRYNTAKKRWTNLGDKAPSDPSARWNCIIWEDDSHKKENIPDFYQGFLGQMRFDFNNRLHVAGAINNNTQYDAASHIIYAYSDDRGNSFYKADGSKIKSLPIRVESGPAQGDIIEGPDQYATFASASFDKDGNPVVTYTRMNKKASHGMDPAFFKYFDKGIWSKRLSYPTGGHVKNIPVVDANGVITFLNNTGKLMRTQKLGTPGYELSLGGNFVSLDERAIREENKLRGMMLKDGKLQIVSLEFSPQYMSTLSAPWKTKNIGSAKGVSATYNNIHQLKSSGQGFTNGQVNAQFSYQKLIGDGSIEARIINVNYSGDNAFAGLMIAESLDGKSFFSSSITAHNGIKTHFSKGGKIEEGKGKGNKQPSEWIRIVREGNKFSAYGSDNGISWYLVEETTIPMDREVYVGMISGSGNDRPGHARMDHLKIACDESSSIEIIKHPENVKTIEGNDAQFEVEATGNNDLKYQWLKDGSSINGATKPVLKLENVQLSDNGNYQVKITDGDHTVLSNKARLTVEEDPDQPVNCSKLTVKVKITNETCKGNDGKVLMTVDGGTGPYTYSWSHGPKSKNLSNLSGGNYTVTISDASGCTVKKKITLNTQPGPAKPIITRSNNNLHLEGVNGLSVQWYLNGSLIQGADGQNLTMNKSGEYHVIVHDPNGCFAASDVFKATIKQEDDEVEQEEEAPAIASVKKDNSTIQQLRVYPVPASTILNIDLQASKMAEISYQILSMAGNLLLDHSFDQDSESKSFFIDVSDLPAGIHLLKLKVFDEIITRRFLKQ
jgi:regulation of enolase protein 1 (concanavalin A-like superfamily)